jgi:2-amino-4-hydroxy-6-hydroxymethyldihydropteridine diphosphokinase
MSRVVLSIGSNLGDRLARLQSVVDALGGAVRAVSPVYETKPWGGVERGPFLNAVLVAEDPALDCRGWLRRAHIRSCGRSRAERWGPRTLDVDLVTGHDGRREVPRVTMSSRCPTRRPICGRSSSSRGWRWTRMPR